MGSVGRGTEAKKDAADDDRFGDQRDPLTTTSTLVAAQKFLARVIQCDTQVYETQ